MVHQKCGCAKRNARKCRMQMSRARLLSVDLGWRRTRTRSVRHRRGRLGALFPGHVRPGPASAPGGTAIASGEAPQLPRRDRCLHDDEARGSSWGCPSYGSAVPPARPPRRLPLRGRRPRRLLPWRSPQSLPRRHPRKKRPPRIQLRSAPPRPTAPGKESPRKEWTGPVPTATAWPSRPPARRKRRAGRNPHSRRPGRRPRPAQETWPESPAAIGLHSSTEEQGSTSLARNQRDEN